RFHSEDPKRLQTQAVPQSGGVFECRVTGEFIDQKNRIVETGRDHATARVLTSTSAPALTGTGLTVPGQWTPLELAQQPQGYRAADVGTVYHGPALWALTGISDERETSAWFRIQLNTISAQAQSRRQREISAPVILDAALQACDVLRH